MRTIKFRGKRVDNGEWVNGNYASRPDGAKFIMPIDNYDTHPIIEKTIGQFTGLLDKNGKEIYEGDICQIHATLKRGHQKEGYFTVGVVEFGRICIREDSLYVFSTFHINSRSIEYLLLDELEVIGNIHDNPELLKN